MAESIRHLCTTAAGETAVLQGNIAQLGGAPMELPDKYTP